MIGITDVNEPGGRAGCFPGGGAAHLVRATGRAGRVRIRSPGKRSATGGDIPTQQKNPTPFGTGFLLKRKNKKLSLSTELSALFDAWQFPTLTWGDPTLPSALRRFTSEFGMGSGGTTALVPPGKFFVLVLCLLRSYCVGCSRECQSHTYVCSFHRLVCRLVSAQNPSDSESELKILSNPPKTASAL